MYKRQHIDKIVSSYNSDDDFLKYSHITNYDEIKNNDFNLNIPRYVDTFEEHEPIDLRATIEEITKLEDEIHDVDMELAKMFDELQGPLELSLIHIFFTTDHVPDKLEPNSYEKFFINALSYTSPKAIDDLTIAFEEDESNDLIQNFQEIDLLDEHVFPDVIDYEFEEVILSPCLLYTSRCV